LATRSASEKKPGPHVAIPANQLPELAGTPAAQPRNRWTDLVLIEHGLDLPSAFAVEKGQTLPVSLADGNVALLGRRYRQQAGTNYVGPTPNAGLEGYDFEVFAFRRVAPLSRELEGHAVVA
jgi:hypothetical protein